MKGVVDVETFFLPPRCFHSILCFLCSNSWLFFYVYCVRISSNGEIIKFFPFFGTRNASPGISYFPSFLLALARSYCVPKSVEVIQVQMEILIISINPLRKRQLLKVLIISLLWCDWWWFHVLLCYIHAGDEISTSETWSWCQWTVAGRAKWVETERKTFKWNRFTFPLWIDVSLRSHYFLMMIILFMWDQELAVGWVWDGIMEISHFPCDIVSVGCRADELLSKIRVFVVKNCC